MVAIVIFVTSSSVSLASSLFLFNCIDWRKNKTSRRCKSFVIALEPETKDKNSLNVFTFISCLCWMAKKEMKKKQTKWSGQFLMLMRSRKWSVSSRTSMKKECEGAIIEIMSFLVPGSRGDCVRVKNATVFSKSASVRTNIWPPLFTRLRY